MLSTGSITPPARVKQERRSGVERTRPVREAFEIAHGSSWAGLLKSFYDRAGLSMPVLHRVQGQRVPEPYRRLLVHSNDMTPTLETFYGQPLGLTVLSREWNDLAYTREVVLSIGAQPVGYGAIRIFLNRFPASAVSAILHEMEPLGRILQTRGIAHIGWPQAFFYVESDQHITGLLSLDQPSRLWGRRNVLLDGTRRLLAEVFEILAPA